MTRSASTARPGRASSPSLRPALSSLPRYVAGRRAESALIAALASNESHFEPLPSVMAVVEQATHQLNRYPDPASIELRERIAARLEVTVEEVVVGPGSAGVLQQVITALCDKGDEVVFAWRSFEAYPILVGVAGAIGVPVALRADEGHDLVAMAAAVTDRTRVIIVCSPNNPTGVAVHPAELDVFLAAVPATVLVVIDEAYIEYTDGQDVIDALALFRTHPNVCVLRTFSKAFGLAGLRVGYAVARGDLADGLRGAAIPFVVSSVAQKAAVASLAATDEMRERAESVIAERSRVVAAARALGWTVADSQANFIWLRVDDEVRVALVAAFTDASILVRAYPDAGVRISLADAATNDRVLAVLAAITRDKRPDSISTHKSAAQR